MLGYSGGFLEQIIWIYLFCSGFSDHSNLYTDEVEWAPQESLY